MSRHRLWRLSITTPIVILFIISYQVESFQVLPYVNIDYEYYLKLGICQSQCTEKYGTVAYKRRLDGSTRSYFNTTNQHYNMCQLGCQNARSSMPNTRSVVEDAFRDGQQFWLSGAQNIPNKKSTLSSTQNADRSPIASLKILCLRQSSSAQANGFLDSYTALLGAQPHKVDFLAPARYLIQWKQRIPLGKNKDQRFDETKWITASIEPDLSFYAEGVQPGVQYRSMVTVIMPSGRMGATVTSDWVEAPSLGAPIPSSPLPLVLTPQFNTDDNTSAVVSFRRDGSASNKRMATPTTCAYHLRYTNSSQQVYAQDFEMDESEGFLLTNLAFNTQYDVELQPLSTLPSNSNVPIDTSNKGASSSAKFRTIACADVFGGGSLQCEPESVRDFDIRINEENSTVLLTWRPSSEPRHVLLYELRYVPVAGEQKCALDESTMYLPAKATSAEILIPGDSQCEVEVYLTNFDLRGREASLTARFVYKRKGSDDEDNSTFYGFDSLSTNIWIIISAPLLVIVALLVILRFAAVGQRKLKKKISGLTVRDETTQKLESKIKCSVGPPPVDV